MSVFDCLLTVFVNRFGRPNHWPMSRANGLYKETMDSVSDNDGFGACVEQILSYPMRIVKTLSCIESLNVHVHSWNLRLHGFVIIMLCFVCWGYVAQLDGTGPLSFVLWFMAFCWCLGMLWTCSAMRFAWFPWTIFRTSFCKQWCPRHMAAMWWCHCHLCCIIGRLRWMLWRNSLMGKWTRNFA